jgi:outer membrane biosynthesis protein TonB
MDLRRIIQPDITASAVAHMSLLTLLVLFSEVHPFGAVTAEQIPVEIVTLQDIPEQPKPAEQQAAETKPEPAPDVSVLDKPAAAPPPAVQPAPVAQPAPAARLQKQATLAAPQAPPPQPAAAPPSQPAPPAYTPSEPDISIRYQVLLGLPPDLSPMPPTSAEAPKGDDVFDAPATEAADISSSVISEFRRHLRTCSKLPAALAGNDDVKVKLRILMSPDGRLAADPILIEASASMKGPLLMQGAIRALQACQPYAMLPADRYGEWKVLDLSFTPKDFSG